MSTSKTTTTAPKPALDPVLAELGLAPGATGATRTFPTTSNTYKVGSIEYTVFNYDPFDPASEQLYVETRILRIIVSALIEGKPVALLGEQGSGKTEIARAVLSRFDIHKFFQQEFGGMVSGDQLDGTFVMVGGETKHLPTEHLKAVRLASEGHRIGYLQDELNRASMFAVNKLLRLYAKPYEYVSDLNEVLKVAPTNLLTIATLNVGFGFTGTNKVDVAVANRYRAIKLMPAPGEIVTKVIEERYPHIDPGAIKQIVRVYDASRKSEDSYKLGMRDVQDLAAAMSYGATLVDAVEVIIGGAAHLQGLPHEAVEAVIATAKSVAK